MTIPIPMAIPIPIKSQANKYFAKGGSKLNIIQLNKIKQVKQKKSKTFNTTISELRSV